ncbi:uncharacterized protein [Parasteatoda tepidariorum]|uniref:uncharacterized protein n=1 Tax=Parasteatoda tepidariorum TaxID=114398 RepID=UPI001C7292E7|nr:uncharacterized protein LOC107445924 [Parasteatoda tepidariorum]
MEISKSEDKIIGKRKRSLDLEKDELELKKPKDDIDNSVKEKASSKTEAKDKENSEPGKEDSSKLEHGKEGSSEAARENSTEQSKAGEFFIEKLLSDALNIVRKEIEVENTAVEKAYNEIKTAFKSSQFTKLNFNNSDYLLTYFSIYAAFNTKLTYNRFLDAFKNCKQLQETVKKQNLNIISLGGGPGTDIIGFCSALQEFLTQEVKNYCSTINISVADIFKRWASFYNVIEFLIREGCYGNVSSLFKSKIVSSSFMTVDLVSEEQPCKYTYDLGTADIVLLVRVLDILNFQETKPENLIKKIISGMRSGALLLVIDSVIKNYNDSEVTQVYSSNLEEFTRQVNMEISFPLYPWKSSSAQSFILQKK